MTAPVFAAALRADGGGVLLDLEVTPGARGERFPDAYNPWRKRLGIRVQAQAEAGRANEDVRRVVAEFFEVRNDAVAITHGRTSSQKTVRVEGIGLGAATARLAAVLA